MGSNMSSDDMNPHELDSDDDSGDSSMWETESDESSDFGPAMLVIGTIANHTVLAAEARNKAQEAKKHPSFTRADTFVIREKVENDLEEEFKVAEEEFEPPSREESSSEDEDGEEDGALDEWTTTDTRRTFPFTANPQLLFGTAKTPLDFFKLLFNEEFVALLVDNINSRGHSFAQVKNKVFTPTDIHEMYTLLSTFFLMGYYSSILKDVFWGERPDPKIHFANYMRMERFLMLHRLLAYKQDEEGDDSAWYEAVKPLADKFNEIMKKLMVPGQMLNLDEDTLIYFNTRCPFVLRKERTRLHFLSDVNSIFQRVYVADPDVEDNGRDVAKALISEFLYKGYTLHTSPRYTSISLAEELAFQNTYSTGFLSEKKFKHPAFSKKNVKSKKLLLRLHKDSKGTKSLVVSGYNRNGVCVCKVFKQNETLSLLSTKVNGCEASDNKWESKMFEEFVKDAPPFLKRQKIMIKCGPKQDRRFNRHVDYVLKVMMVNAYLMYGLTSEKKMTFTDFLEEILYQMLPLEAKPKKNTQPKARQPGKKN